MAVVNNITNIARKIVSKLDADDKKSDGKIEASIWNKFVCKKQGNEISNYINTDRALKSVVAYLKREAAKTGQAIEDIANEWLDKLGVNQEEVDKTQIKPVHKDENAYSVPAIIIEKAHIYTDDGSGRELTSAEQKVCDIIADNAMSLLLDVGNDNYRYKITNRPDDFDSDFSYFTATLADGRKIEIRAGDRNDSGCVEIETIKVLDHKKAEALSLSWLGCFAHSKNIENGCASYLATTDMDFSQIIEKIFGNALREKYGSDIKIDANIKAWESDE